MGNSGRRRHAAQGAESSGGGCLVVGGDDVQLDGILHQDRRWVEVTRKRYYGDKL